MPHNSVLPEAISTTLRVDVPSEAEKVQTRLLNHAEWGGALRADDYLSRETYLETIPLATNGGIRSWILTESEPVLGERRVLASCETWRKRVLVTNTGTEKLSEGIAYGIGSVFTYPQYRGRGYCSRLLKELQIMLHQGFDKKSGESMFPFATALWSDIGRGFYARMGWMPYESFHVTFPVPNVYKSLDISMHSGEITYENLEEFAVLDERLLRGYMTAEANLGKRLFAFVPDHDTLRWHLFRDGWITQKLFPGSSEENVKGAFAGKVGTRVWAVWTRNYDEDPMQVQKNSLNIIRLVVEDKLAPLEQLMAAFLEVMKRAERMARGWGIGQIVLWNPDTTAKTIIETSGLPCETCERQEDSIPSLFYPSNDTQRVEWVANEKFGWC